MNRSLILFAASSLAIAVASGALGAHFLKSKLESGILTPGNIDAFETAVRYQIYHSLALFIVFFLRERQETQLLKISVYLFIAGIVFFSGSIYFLSTQNLSGFSNIRWMGPITPIGGFCFITGWILLFINFLKK